MYGSGDSVPDAGHRGFEDAPLARDVVSDFEIVRAGAAAGQVNQLVGGVDEGQLFAVGQDFRGFRRRMVFVDHLIQWSIHKFSFALRVVRRADGRPGPAPVQVRRPARAGFFLS